MDDHIGPFYLLVFGFGGLTASMMAIASWPHLAKLSVSIYGLTQRENAMWKFVSVVLFCAVSFVAGVVGANHCPVIAHLSGGPCAAVHECKCCCCCECGCQNGCCHNK